LRNLKLGFYCIKHSHCTSVNHLVTTLKVFTFTVQKLTSTKTPPSPYTTSLLKLSVYIYVVSHWLKYVRNNIVKEGYRLSQWCGSGCPFFWHTPCQWIIHSWHFKGMHCLHLQGLRDPKINAQHFFKTLEIRLSSKAVSSQRNKILI
jgi:hypothetical protein